jgi:hypothetical protein
VISPDLTRDEKAHQGVSGGPISLDVSGAEYYNTLLDIAPSSLDAGVIWTGSDDGLVHVTRDGGTTWNDVTPADWPHAGRIEAVEPGRFAPGTAFLNIDRHELGDRAPYLYMTDDYGASWHSIVGNLPAQTPVRTIRQDPKSPDILYAGTETGVWISFDRGARWSSLKLNLPTTPVFDLRIQPVADDLIVATHGRGIFILDDLAPLQALAAARQAGGALFPIRNATLFAQWPPIETGEGGALPSNFVVGQNPPAGALLAFYERSRPRVRPTIDIVAADGRIVRHLAGSTESDEGRKFVVPSEPGINRLAWDGLEDGPVKWHGTTRQNRGPDGGPEALPGRYVARLHLAGQTFEQPFELAADPASPWTLTQLGDRHAFLSALFAEFSQVDTLLNRIDDDERRLGHATDAATVAKRARLDAARRLLTSDARNDEDGIGRPDRVRERLGGLIGALGSSFQPPLAAHLAAAEQLKTVVTQTVAQAQSALDAVAMR